MYYDGLRIVRIFTLLLHSEPLTTREIFSVIVPREHWSKPRAIEQFRNLMVYYRNRGYVVRSIDTYGAMRYTLSDSVKRELHALQTATVTQ